MTTAVCVDYLAGTVATKTLAQTGTLDYVQLGEDKFYLVCEVPSSCYRYQPQLAVHSNEYLGVYCSWPSFASPACSNWFPKPFDSYLLYGTSIFICCRLDSNTATVVPINAQELTQFVATWFELASTITVVPKDLSHHIDHVCYIELSDPTNLGEFLITPRHSGPGTKPKIGHDNVADKLFAIIKPIVKSHYNRGPSTPKTTRPKSILASPDTHTIEDASIVPDIKSDDDDDTTIVTHDDESSSSPEDEDDEDVIEIENILASGNTDNEADTDFI